MSLSEGGGDPSTQPFQPFFVATRFLRGGALRVGGSGTSNSSSSGVCGLLEEVRDVLEECDGPGVEPGVEAKRGEGGSETLTDRVRCVLWI